MIQPEDIQPGDLLIFNSVIIGRHAGLVLKTSLKSVPIWTVLWYHGRIGVLPSDLWSPNMILRDGTLHHFTL